MVGSAPRFASLETESATDPSEIDVNPCGKGKKRENAERRNSRRFALTGGPVSFVTGHKAPWTQPSSKRLSP